MQAQLSITQALPQLKRTRLIAYKNIKSGKLPATLTIIDGRAAYLINQDDLSKFIAERDSKQNRHP
jgi:hypothetical protein